MAFHAKRAMDAYREGAKMRVFAWDCQNNYLNIFLNSNDSQASGMRDFIKREWGEQFWNDVMVMR